MLRGGILAEFRDTKELTAAFPHPHLSQASLVQASSSRDGVGQFPGIGKHMDKASHPASDRRLHGIHHFRSDSKEDRILGRRNDQRVCNCHQNPSEFQ
ncbi:hypothetical protein LSAT2_020096, partial [Lamellibrachia satsuma]